MRDEIMSFEEFCEFVAEQLRKQFPDVRITTTCKANIGKKVGFALSNGERIAPIVYAEHFYQMYCNGSSFEEIEQCIIDTVESAKDESTEILALSQGLSVWETAKKTITPVLLCKSLNTEFVEKYPGRDFLDLRIAYRVIVKDDRNPASCTVTEELRECWGVTEEDLYCTAMENLKKTNWFSYRMGDLLCDIAPDLCTDAPVDFPLYVLTNGAKLNGSAVLLDNEFLAERREQIGDFYILPSSKHEVLALPFSVVDDPSSLPLMVGDVNKQCVADEDILSYSVYKFTEEAGKVELV